MLSSLRLAQALVVSHRCESLINRWHMKGSMHMMQDYVIHRCRFGETEFLFVPGIAIRVLSGPELMGNYSPENGWHHISSGSIFSLHTFFGIEHDYSPITVFDSVMVSEEDESPLVTEADGFSWDGKPTHPEIVEYILKAKETANFFWFAPDKLGCIGGHAPCV
jgi:hypothetical protein